jgi:hypothetical protein
MKKPRVKVVEQGNKIILTFNQISDLKSVRNFEPANSTLKVHKANKGKGSYNRKEKHKNRDDEKDSSLCFLFTSAWHLLSI